MQENGQNNDRINSEYNDKAHDVFNMMGTKWGRKKGTK